jgi:hypothetical protein
LTRTATGPDGSVIGPAGKSEGVTPATDPGEEVTLDESSQIIGSNIFNWPLIDVAIGYQSSLDQFS